MEQEKKKDEIVLPTAPREATRKVPRTMVIYGKPKSGKTSAISNLKNALIVDTENGSAFVKGMVISPPDKYGPVKRYNWLKELATKITSEGKPYDYVIIDTLSQLDIESEWVGTRKYMSSISGKKFNREIKDGITGREYKPSEPEYESVHTLGQGYGYRYSREAMLDLIDAFKECAKICTIFICHVMDKMVGEKDGEIIYTKDMALTGKVRDIVTRTVDAIATVWTEDSQLMISFEGNKDKIGGMRGMDHLQNYSGPLEWNKIFIETETK